VSPWTAPKDAAWRRGLAWAVIHEGQNIFPANMHPNCIIARSLDFQDTDCSQKICVDDAGALRRSFGLIVPVGGTKGANPEAEDYLVI
jgi:hypothetical protein